MSTDVLAGIGLNVWEFVDERGTVTGQAICLPDRTVVYGTATSRLRRIVRGVPDGSFAPDLELIGPVEGDPPEHPGYTGQAR